MPICLGCYQSRFGISEIKVDEYLTQGYRLHLDLIKRHQKYVYYRDAIIGLGIICNTYLDLQKYGKAYIWTERLVELIRGYEKVPDVRPGYAEKQWSRYYINSAIALEGLSRKREAAQAYQLFEQTSFSRTAEGSILGSIYLGLAGRWQESADNSSNLNTLMKEQNVGYSLENIQKMLLKKFDINLQAGRIDSAKAISMDIVQHLDSAITQARGGASEGAGDGRRARAEYSRPSYRSPGDDSHSDCFSADIHHGAPSGSSSPQKSS